MTEKDQSLIEDLRYVAKYPGNYFVSRICRKAADRLEELAGKDRWYENTDPLLMKFWGAYRQRTADTDMEVIVMIAGATVPTCVCFDGESFYDGIDPVPVVCWQPLPEPPIQE